jgi:CRP/FNR family transcriptional regulator
MLAKTKCVPAGVKAHPSTFLGTHDAALPQRVLWSSLWDLCRLLGIAHEPGQFDRRFRFQHVRVSPGQSLYRMGDPFEMLYVVNGGFLKTVLIDESGSEHVTAFPMKGDLLGLDGFHTGCYASEVVALSECDVILVPFRELESSLRAFPASASALCEILSQELLREHAHYWMARNLSAEGRVGQFLVALSARYSKLGYSGHAMRLWMTRRDIGRHIGVSMETVSRTLNAFDALGLIGIDGRKVVLHDINALARFRRLPPSRARSLRSGTFKS